MSKPVIQVENLSKMYHLSEVLGIIGRKGAGTATLLKLLSLITQPTRFGNAEGQTLNKLLREPR
jgi:ABC-type polysaccharide/polyol phosphate transport system ATPase subunit